MVIILDQVFQLIEELYKQRHIGCIAYNLKYTHTKYENIIPLNKVRTKLLNKF